MSAVLLGSILLGSTIAIRIEDAVGVTPEETRGVAEALSVAFENRTGTAPVLELAEEQPCDADDRCVAAIKTRTQADEIVFVKLLGGLTKIRVLAERLKLETGAMRNAQADLGKTPRDWPLSLEGIALILFPEARATPPVAATPPPKAEPPPTAKADPPKADPPKLDPQPKPPEAPGGPELTEVAPPPSESKVVPWVIFGASATAGVVGTVFGVLAQDARNTLEGPGYVDLTPEEIDSKTAMAKNGAWTANVLWVAAGVGIATSTLMLLDVF